MGPRLQVRIPHTDGDEQFGARLRECREGLGMSQRDLAFPGCSAAYISRIERGERRPSLQVIEQMAHRLGVNAKWLATGKESHKHDQYVIGLFSKLTRAELDELNKIYKACRKRGGTVGKLRQISTYAEKKFK